MTGEGGAGMWLFFNEGRILWRTVVLVAVPPPPCKHVVNVCGGILVVGCLHCVSSFIGNDAKINDKKVVCKKILSVLQEKNVKSKYKIRILRLNFICGSTRLTHHEIPIKFRKGRARSGGTFEFVEDELKSSVLHKGTVDGEKPVPTGRNAMFSTS